MRKRTFQNHAGVGGLMGRARQVAQIGQGVFINQEYGGLARGNTGAATDSSASSGGGAPPDDEEEVDTSIIDTFESYELGDVSHPSDLEEGVNLGECDIAPNQIASVAFDNFEAYTLGPGPTVDLGVGFEETDIVENYLGLKASETFEDYAVGAVTEGDLDQGTGWNGIPDLV